MTEVILGGRLEWVEEIVYYTKAFISSMGKQKVSEELEEALRHLNNAVEISEDEGMEKFGLRLKYLRDKCKGLLSRISDEE